MIVLLMLLALFYWVFAVVVCVVSKYGQQLMDDFHEKGIIGFCPWVLYIVVTFPLIGFPIYATRYLMTSKYNFTIFKLFNVLKFISSFFVLNYAALKKAAKYEHN
jgi:hypothetical protein